MIPRRQIPLSAGDMLAWSRALLHRDDPSMDWVREFELAFARYLGCRFAHATSSGRNAIVLALQASGARPGDEILVPAITLGELLPILQGVGFEPVAVDVDADTFNIDVRQLVRHIGPKTGAVLATHLLGGPCDIEAICAAARERGFAVVEDCAHALGATVGGRKVGTFGDAAIFSFEVTKAVPTYGGGMVVTSQPEISERVALDLATHEHKRGPTLNKALSTWLEEALIRSPLYGPTARILFSERFQTLFEKAYRGVHDQQRPQQTAYTAFQAQLGLRRLARVDRRNARMNRRYEQLARELPPGLTVSRRDAVGHPAFYQFVVRSHRIAPREFRRRALAHGVDVGIGSEVVDDCGALLGAGDCPVAADLCENAILLPLYESLSDRRFGRLIDVLHCIASEADAGMAG